jgi:HAMP domain-containing protein
VDEESARVAAAPLSGHPGWVAAAAGSLTAYEATQGQVARELAVGGAVFTAVAGLGAYGLARAALSPVERLRRQVAAVSEHGRAPGAAGAAVEVPSTRDEIAALAGTMNDLLGRLQRALARQRPSSPTPATNCATRSRWCRGNSSLQLGLAGDFEGVLSFGIGLAAQGSYHVFTITSPHRLMIDVGHVALGTFPDIWDITSWPQYWATQYSWPNGHPWLSSPSSVVRVWTGGYGSASVVRQVSANTFKVTRPDGKTFTVTSVRPVSVSGPWVITKIV